MNLGKAIEREAERECDSWNLESKFDKRKLDYSLENIFEIRFIFSHRYANTCVSLHHHQHHSCPNTSRSTDNNLNISKLRYISQTQHRTNGICR